jgi:hypothetical protein
MINPRLFAKASHWRLRWLSSPQMSATTVIYWDVQEGDHQWEDPSDWGQAIEIVWCLHQTIWPKGSLPLQEEPWESYLIGFGLICWFLHVACSCKSYLYICLECWTKMSPSYYMFGSLNQNVPRTCWLKKPPLSASSLLIVYTQHGWYIIFYGYNAIKIMQNTYSIY